VIRERPIAGFASARPRGRKSGRPAKLTQKQACTARKMLAVPEATIKEGGGVWELASFSVHIDNRLSGSLTEQRRRTFLPHSLESHQDRATTRVFRGMSIGEQLGGTRCARWT